MRSGGEVRGGPPMGMAMDVDVDRNGYCILYV